jgi:hypothetical protein
LLKDGEVVAQRGRKQHGRINRLNPRRSHWYFNCSHNCHVSFLTTEDTEDTEEEGIAKCKIKIIAFGNSHFAFAFFSVISVYSVVIHSLFR